jgi:LPXTG-motif cell wall-anchored protein
MRNKVYISALIILLMIVTSSQPVSASKVGNIIIHPSNKFLFKIDNMKPGDWAERTLSIENAGNESIDYSLRVVNKSSHNKLFNELELEVLTEKSESLFNDKLRNFKGLLPKHLLKSDSDTLNFMVKMPYELGNEYQGTSAHFEIIIIAELDDNTTPDDDSKEDDGTPEHPDSDDPNTDDSDQPGKITPDPTQVNPDVNGSASPVSSQGPKLPNTATNLFNILFLGIGCLITGIMILLIKRNLQGKKE